VPAPSVARLKVSFGGNINTGTWETSIWESCSTPTVPTAAEILAAITAQYTEWNTQCASFFETLMYRGDALQTVRGDWYAPDSNAISATATYLPTALEGTINFCSPASTSMVVSLYTALHSRSGRGRMYWPATAYMQGAADEHGFAGDQITGFANGMAAFCAFVNNPVPSPPFGQMTAVVQSQKLGLVTPVTTIKIDGRPDRQEHRERGLLFPSAQAAV